MLQASEIQKRFTHLEQTIEKASQACHADATVPKELMDCVDQLDKKSGSAKKNNGIKRRKAHASMDRRP